MGIARQGALLVPLEAGYANVQNGGEHPLREAIALAQRHDLFRLRDVELLPIGAIHLVEIASRNIKLPDALSAFWADQMLELSLNRNPSDINRLVFDDIRGIDFAQTFGAYGMHGFHQLAFR